MAFIKALSKGLLTAMALVAVNVSAQVSNVEGLTPLEGVVIPKVNQPQAVKPGAVFKDCDECPEMVVIPAGNFLMGSPPDPEQDPFSNAKPVKAGDETEKPQHLVTIQSFAIGKYEVTQEQWNAVMGNNPSSIKGRFLAVESISWNDAQSFVQKLSQKTGKHYRLPTEAEWEYAARAGTTTQYFWGNNLKLVGDYAWYKDNFEGFKSVGFKKPNQFGLYDMIGNVWEWTQDCWNENYIGAPTDGSAWIKGECSRRVLRGGSRQSFPGHLRASYRIWYSTWYKDWESGLRVARDL